MRPVPPQLHRKSVVSQRRLKLVLSQLRHPERTLSSSKGQSKDPDALNLTGTAQILQPQNRVPHLREAKVGSQDIPG